MAATYNKADARGIFRFLSVKCGDGVNLPEVSRHAAVDVDKILRGTKPADLPIEQPAKLELLINLKTAKELGLTVPQSFLARADEVIQ